MPLEQPSSHGFIRTMNVAVVGAGAAGLAAAIFAARRMPDRRVVALDGAEKIGAKILVSGGGRCNVTNERVEAADFWGTSRNSIKQVLAAFPASAAVEFFRQIGVALHQEENGKLFPDSHSAKTVVTALLRELKQTGAELLPGHRVWSIQRAEGHFTLETSRGRLSARAVVLATGGLSLPKTGSDGGGYQLARSLGHSTVPTTPGLAPLVLDGQFHVPLSGIAHEVESTVISEGAKPFSHRGNLLWTHFGVSGPVVLDISRHWHRAMLEGRKVEVLVNMFPGLDAPQVEQQWIMLAQSQPRTLILNALSTLLPGRVASAVLDELEVDKRIVMAHCSKEIRRRLAQALTHWPLPVRDSRGYNFAEVTAGGIPLNEINPHTMQSRICPGLFLVGEILDVDGRIGGFNFQWAWSSGFVAAAGLQDYFSK